MSHAGSLIYANEQLYRVIMRVLYGRNFHARYRALAEEIPPRATVVDLCAGDCYLYRKFLRAKDVDYIGLDSSPALVRAAQRDGAQARQFDVWQEEIPPADIVVMQASLYQFLPQAREIIARMLAAARVKVLIAEPVRNLSSSHLAWLATLSRRLSKPSQEQTGYSGDRFNEASLRAVFQAFPALERMFFIPGGREMVGVFRGRA